MKSKIILVVLGLVFCAGMGYIIWHTTSAPGEHDKLAQCLADKGAKFYGAFWCPHCQKQKTMFGSSAKLLPYVECSTPDGKNQTQICKDNKIEGYPTWIFPNGERLSGEIELKTLAEKTECPLQ